MNLLDIIIGIFLFLFIVHIIKWARNSNRATAHSDEKGFSQAGVHVNYESGEVDVGGKKYHVSDVLEVVHSGNVVTLKVRDMDNPTHKIKMDGYTHRGMQETAEVFYERVKMALEKAGAKWK